ncbi:hypothetical protein J4401_06035 [Candidatus Woesearchaeota archaeon]|nr:hypothetical protein [Candidatus Woesearchaeota archaeon]
MYERTQFGKFIVFPLVIALAFLLYFGRKETYIISAVLFLALLLFYKITVSVDETSLKAVFGIGFIQKKFLLKDIALANPVRTKWYNGWGIHLTPNGWLYNVSGFDAVEIAMKNGKKYMIGIDDKEGVIRAIKSYSPK